MTGPPKDWMPPEATNGDITWLSEYEPEEVTYVEYPLLQSATFHLLTGRPDIGKGVLCAYWVARCTNGDMYGKPKRALWLSSEDSTKRALRPRLDVAGGDPSLVALMPLSFQLPRDIDWLHDKLTSVVADAGLIIIDPIANHLASVDSNTEEPIRSALMPLNDLADALDTPIIGIRHVSTKDAKGSFLSRILGSSAWIAIPRVVLGVGADDEERLHVRAIKGNAAPKSESGKRFKLVGVEYRGFERGMVRAVADGDSDVNIDDLLGAKLAPPKKMDEAMKAMVMLLREQADGKLLSDVVDTECVLRAGVTVETMRKVRTTARSWGWVGYWKDGQAGRWHLYLKNSAPDNSRLDVEIERMKGNSDLARGDTIPSDFSFSTTTYPATDPSRPNSELSGAPLQSAESQLRMDEPETSELEAPSPKSEQASSELVCPTCGSTKIGENSGRCHDCGTKVHPGTDWSTVHVPGLEEGE